MYLLHHLSWHNVLEGIPRPALYTIFQMISKPRHDKTFRLPAFFNYIHHPLTLSTCLLLMELNCHCFEILIVYIVLWFLCSCTSFGAQFPSNMWSFFLKCNTLLHVVIHLPTICQFCKLSFCNILSLDLLHLQFFLIWLQNLSHQYIMSNYEPFSECCGTLFSVICHFH